MALSSFGNTCYSCYHIKNAVFFCFGLVNSLPEHVIKIILFLVFEEKNLFAIHVINLFIIWKAQCHSLMSESFRWIIQSTTLSISERMFPLGKFPGIQSCSNHGRASPRVETLLLKRLLYNVFFSLCY